MCLSCQPLDGRPRNLGKSFWPLANDKMLLHTPIICHLDCHDRLRNKNFIGHIKLIFFPSPFSGPTALFPEICSFVYLSIVTHQTCSWRRRSWCRLKSWLTLPVPRKRTPCVSSILGWFLFSHFPLSGVIRNGLPSKKMNKLEKIVEQNQLYRIQMVQFECPRYRTPMYHPFWGWFPFSHFPLSGVMS